MNVIFFLQVMVETPDVIKNETQTVQIIYLFGSVIVMGLVTALLYMKSQNNRKDEIINEKNNEIKSLVKDMHEADKANLSVLKDVVSIVKNSSTITTQLEKLIMSETNPNIRTILREVSNSQNQ